jgi:hypothetical protein
MDTFVIRGSAVTLVATYPGQLSRKLMSCAVSSLVLALIGCNRTCPPNTKQVGSRCYNASAAGAEAGAGGVGNLEDSAAIQAGASAGLSGGASTTTASSVNASAGMGGSISVAMTGSSGTNGSAGSSGMVQGAANNGGTGMATACTSLNFPGAVRVSVRDT